MSIIHSKSLLIVDDSAFMRKLLSDFFADHPYIRVVGTARNGMDAIKKIQMLKPDIVTMDIEMPLMNGLEALKVIMKDHPLPVIMLSSATQSGAKSTFEAMDAGAVDFIPKPSGAISLDLKDIKSDIIRIVENAATVHVSKLTKKREPIDEKFNISKNLLGDQKTVKPLNESNVKTQTSTSSTQKSWHTNAKKIVLIGTSTGGPRALQEVIPYLPQDMKAPVIIVQHMPMGFTKSLANRLDQLSKIRVKEAEQGDILQNGVAYIAPGGYHLRLRKVAKTYAIELDNVEPPNGGHRPSVDIMFDSVSQFNDLDKIAVIMTGMGSDGTKGLQALKRNGNVKAIAESANTSVVYGMSKAAYATGLVDEVADLHDISKTIMKYLT